MSSDVTYVQAPKDVFENHIYFSAIINHKTKLIDSWNLSLENDTNLVIDHIKDFDFGGELIFHTDHGFEYSLHVFKEIIQAKGGKQSMLCLELAIH